MKCKKCSQHCSENRMIQKIMKAMGVNEVEAWNQLNHAELLADYFLLLNKGEKNAKV